MKPYTFEIIPDTEQKQAAWRLGIKDSDGAVVASSVVHSRPTAIGWASKRLDDYDFNGIAAREAIDAAFFGPEKTKPGVQPNCRFQADAKAEQGIVWLKVYEREIIRMSAGVTNRDAAESWAQETSKRFPLNSVQVEAELDKAFAAIKPEPAENPPIDAPELRTNDGYIVRLGNNGNAIEIRNVATRKARSAAGSVWHEAWENLPGTVEDKSNPPIDAEFHVIEDGGTEFPCSQSTKHFGPGMSLRDWFAAFALNGLVSDYQTSELTIQQITEDAYDFADAMIAERAKHK